LYIRLYNPIYVYWIILSDKDIFDILKTYERITRPLYGNVYLENQSPYVQINFEYMNIIYYTFVNKHKEENNTASKDYHFFVCLNFMCKIFY